MSRACEPGRPRAPTAGLADEPARLESDVEDREWQSKRQHPRRRFGRIPKFGSKLAAKFINCMMWEGKKTVAERIFYSAMNLVTQRVKDGVGG